MPEAEAKRILMMQNAKGRHIPYEVALQELASVIQADSESRQLKNIVRTFLERETFWNTNSIILLTGG